MAVAPLRPFTSGTGWSERSKRGSRLNGFDKQKGLAAAQRTPEDPVLARSGEKDAVTGRTGNWRKYSLRNVRHRFLKIHSQEGFILHQSVAHHDADDLPEGELHVERRAADHSANIGSKNTSQGTRHQHIWSDRAASGDDAMMLHRSPTKTFPHRDRISTRRGGDSRDNPT